VRRIEGTNVNLLSRWAFKGFKKLITCLCCCNLKVAGKVLLA
jgi:hypothetical protein